MALRAAIKASRATGIGLGALGFFWGGFAALMPDWQARAGVSDAGLGLLLLLASLGGMSAMAAGPWVQRALGALSLPVLAAQLGGVGLMAWAIGSPLSLGLVLIWLGWSMAGLDIASNVEISHREAETGLPLMNWNHALFSFGFAGAAALAGIARQAGVGPGAIMAANGVCVLIAALATRERVTQAGAASERASLGHPPWAIVVPAGIILFLAFVAENSTESWSALHIERSFGATTGAGAFGPMMFGLMMGLGRVFGQMAAARLGEAQLVALSAVLAAFGATLSATAPVQWLAVAGIALIGVGSAVVVPSVNSLLGQRVARAGRALAMSRAWLIGFTGFFVGPVVMGAIAQGVGLRWAFAAIALILIAILPGLARLMRAPQL
ncbi:MFS transporter [Thioclava sp.]|uniref:MFS transporter n=1 Tax=Thioclava sp. TaxID=1933450 RepID=UPI003AA8C20C